MKIFIFFIKVTNNILWIIKKNIKFENCSFNFKQTFSNLIESIRGWFPPIKKKLKGKEKRRRRRRKKKNERQQQQH